MGMIQRFLPILCLPLLAGCDAADNAVQQPSSRKEEVANPPLSAFALDASTNTISLDTRVAPPQRRRFDIGQGSITLETLQVRDNKLTFRYTPEIEGGYTVYECVVPVSATPLTVQIARDGTPGATSFDLKACKVIRYGSVHFD